MTVFLNGQFVSSEQALISVFDRGFLYGDGLFETLRVRAGKPFRWQQHLGRLQQGGEFLKIRLPFNPQDLHKAAARLIEENNAPESILRISLSRGIGVRGYSPKGADQPVLVMSLHPAPAHDPNNPARWQLITSSFRLPAGDSLACFKTCNKLPQILARAEAEAQGADEALLLNTDGAVAEAASSNLFWIDGQVVCTPPLAAGILSGVTRAVTLELCNGLGIQTQERNIIREALQQVDGIFLTLSSLGIVEASELDHQPLRRSSLLSTLQTAYAAQVNLECGPTT
jgi:aminodeoxychorismate lyase